MEKTISVVMSVYNDSGNLESSISSVLNQDFQDFEFLIMNDGSSDDTQNILNKFSKDKRIKIFKNKKNLGLTKSLNLLLAESKGEYVARQDSDDLSISERFTKQLNYIENNNLDLCGSRAIIKGSTRITPNRSYYLPLNVSLKIKNPFIHGSLIFKKSVVEKVNNYDERFKYSQDYKLIKDVFLEGFSLGIVKEPLYVLNLENNISTNFKENKIIMQIVKNNKVPIDNLKISFNVAPKLDPGVWNLFITNMKNNLESNGNKVIFDLFEPDIDIIFIIDLGCCLRVLFIL